MSLRKIFFILLVLVILDSYAQKQASNWYFGQGAALSFNTEPPTVLTDSRLYTYEGCATISDKNGNLLFYTNGVTVYNKEHKQMPNGINLLGDPSSTQSAIIVPKPEDDKIYYIFTVGFSNPGLRYSTVDMSLDNGNGDVLEKEKNITLLGYSAEKITAVKHLDGESIWVISFDGGTFHSFKVSSNGINTTSVESSIGEFIADPRGYLKASPNGEFLAMANHLSPTYLLPFFSGNGRVFPGVVLEFENLNEQAYGVEFSAENKKLYVDTFLQEGTNDPDTPINTRFLYQYDLNSNNVNNTRKLISTNEDSYRGALQLALNGKIYRALSSQYEIGSPFIGVINNPELNGVLCDYQHDAINLSPSFRKNFSTQGLPPFIQSLFFFTINVKNACENQIAELSLNTIEENFTVHWDLGDGNTSTEINPTHKYPSAGFYKVIATMQLENGESKSIEKTIQIFEVPNLFPNLKMKQCDNDGNNIANFNLNEIKSVITNDDIDLYDFQFYESIYNLENSITIDSSTPYQNITSNPQEIWVKVTNQIGCEETTKFIVEAIDATLGPIEDFVICDDSNEIFDDSFGTFNLNKKENDIRNKFNLANDISLNFYFTEIDAEFENNMINIEEELITESRLIWVRAESSLEECKGIEPLNLIVNQIPKSLIYDNYNICLNKPFVPVVIDGGENYDSYEWRNIKKNTVLGTNRIINIFEIGDYSLTTYINANGIQCSRTQYFKVNPSNIANFQLIEVKDASSNNIITINVSGEGNYEFALYNEDNNIIYRDFQNNNIFQNVFPGIYTIRVKDVKANCGSISEKVSVIGFPKFFTPNSDGKNDNWQVYGVSSMFQSNSKILIFNRFGKLIKQLDPKGMGWDGLFNGQLMPSDDYWFSVTLQDGRTFKSHFTLKR